MSTEPKQLSDDSLRDYEAVKLLADWRKRESAQFLLDACYEAMTADTPSPRMGTVRLAVEIMRSIPNAEDQLWQKFQTESRVIAPHRVASWICGFYYLPFNEERFSRFSRFVKDCRSNTSKLLVAVMLATWRSTPAETVKAGELTSLIMEGVDLNGASEQEILMINHLNRQAG